MRILHYIASEGVGGMETHVRTLCAELSKKQTMLVLEDKNIHRWNPFSVVLLYWKIKKYNPDIIHAHGSKAAQIIAWPLFHAFRRVATVHGIKKRLGFLSNFDAVVAVSGTVAERIRHPFCVVIYNGVVPPEKIPPRPDNHTRLVLAVGRLASVKGFDVLIRAWAKVDADAQLRIAGDGPERENLEKLIRENGLEDSVCILGFRSDVPALIDESDLLVISSRREGMPLVLVEALQRGCPVVSTAVGGMKGFLPEDILVEPESPEALAKGLGAALSDLPALSCRLAEKFAFARSTMTVEVMAEQTEQVYGKVLQK